MFINNSFYFDYSPSTFGIVICQTLANIGLYVLDAYPDDNISYFSKKALKKYKAKNLKNDYDSYE